MSTLGQVPEAGLAPSPPALGHRSRLATWCSFVPAGLVILLALFGRLLAPNSSTSVIADPNLSPGGKYLFGTDSSGMDVLSRTLVGFGYDVWMGLAITAMSSMVGVVLGLAVGMYEHRRGSLGLIAKLFGRGLDLLQAIPAVVLALVIVSFFGSSVLVMMVSVSVVLMPFQARVVRSETLRVRGESYVEAARISGYSELRLIRRHVLPNASWPALENLGLIFGSAIFIIAALGFLGIGLPIPTPEWGSMISVGAPAAAVGRWWSAFFPALALAITVAAFAAAGHRYFSVQPHQKTRKRKS